MHSKRIQPVQAHPTAVREVADRLETTAWVGSTDQRENGFLEAMTLWRATTLAHPSAR